MPNYLIAQLNFGRLGRRIIEASFKGGALSSDGGVMLLRQLDRDIDWLKRPFAIFYWYWRYLDLAILIKTIILSSLPGIAVVLHFAG